MWQQLVRRARKMFCLSKKDRIVRQSFPTAVFRGQQTTKLRSSRPLDNEFTFGLPGCHLQSLLSFGWAWVGGGLTQSAGRRIAVRAYMSKRIFSAFFYHLNIDYLFCRLKREFLKHTSTLRRASLPIGSGHLQPTRIRMKGEK